MTTAQTLRNVADGLESPFRFEWATGVDLDGRALGNAEWLPIMALLYFVTLTALKLLAGAEWLKSPLKWVALANNVLMTAYSAWTTTIVTCIVLANWADDQWDYMHPLCDQDRLLMKGLDLQMYIFFLSKFWEWIDTWILVLKGKPVWPPANVQFVLHIFHHTTTASVAWVAWRQEFTVAWLGPLSNGFVHTLMYGYYSAVTIAPSVRKYGLYITPIQITQFIVCLLSLLPDAFDTMIHGGARCGSTTRAVIWMLFTYGAYLGMFVIMFGIKKKAAKRDESRARKTN